MQLILTLLAAATLSVTTSGLPHPQSQTPTCKRLVPVTGVDLFGTYQCAAYGSHDETLQFNIGPVASGAGPCTLIAQFPQGYSVRQLGHGQLYVYGLAGNSTGAQVGTVGPFPVDERGLMSHDVYTTINSFECKDVLKFRFSVGSEDQEGFFGFLSTSEAGFFVKVGDC
ncbi:uncharacterized protein BCR38DRAFT_476431 [Pseudomassariella vexata]|uniref:Ubiquitin 3 binding protein But2 C-terminal domain-containing protein n=1 Tax=Pseudomassariella vexata TaxID=1141098 RepID=A0A1Y2DR64_9PEZI|nr:uncharacterized protein BCR38DRAFT_476431 [Pseudomassariella vexata]ORY61778.1 hypothetical protein BCR38DRAFT_476431 [Pseudomassariella vexata]